jgi:hypothetical protein
MCRQLVRREVLKGMKVCLQ